MTCVDAVRIRLQDARGGALSTRRLEDLTGWTKSTINNALHQLVLAGEVERTGCRGFYRFRLRAPELEVRRLAEG